MSIRPVKFAFCLTLFAAMLPGGAFVARAQRAFSVSLSLTNQSHVLLGWTVQAATPPGDILVVPQYQVQRSADLLNWTNVGAPLSGRVLAKVSFLDSVSNAGFYRVQSILNLEYAQLNNDPLDSGQLAGADFFGASLFNASLTSAQLNMANFSGANLENADLFEADLDGANLFGVEAADANFASASLIGADMVRADLTGANLGSAVLVGASLDLAKFPGTILDMNTVLDPKPALIWQIINQGAPNAVFTNGDLSLSFLEGANLNGANMSGADLFGTDLERADIRGANLAGANLGLVDFLGAQIDTNTVLGSQALLVWNILNENAGVGANLAGSGLTNVWLAAANLAGANLSGANCTNSVFLQANLGGANCAGANFLQGGCSASS